MEVVFSPSIPASTRSLSPLALRAKWPRPTSLFGVPVALPCKRARCPYGKNPGAVEFRPRAAAYAIGTTATTPSTSGATNRDVSAKAEDLVFVAGSTGRVGSRTVRELLKLGFRVRAGVRSSQRAEALVQSVQQMKLDKSTETSEAPPVEKLEIVECDLENQGAIGPAIGDASIVICCIGASEKEVFDITGPYRIDFKATKNLIQAATTSKVNHFILLTSLGTNKIGFPAAILNLFWGVLIWKRKAEEALIASDLPYTIVRPGGMERPTDAYKQTHNLILANEDTYFGGQVSNLQVAELMACMAKNRKLSYCKVVEVIAETTAPLLPMEDLLAGIPSQRELPLELELDPLPSIPDKEIVRDVPEQGVAQKAWSLSPYIAYDDLKPPSSPSPTPSTSQAKSEPKVNARESSLGFNKSQFIQDQDGKPSGLSPYSVYDDLKPPTSPSPNVPAKSVNEQHAEHQKQQPLSPYTMYADLKPPTSPVPSVPK